MLEILKVVYRTLSGVEGEYAFRGKWDIIYEND